MPLNNKSWKPHHNAQSSSKSSKAKQTKLKKQTIPKQEIQDASEETDICSDPLQIPLFFLKTFEHLFDPALQELVQKVKQHLYNREYAVAFGSQKNLEAYVIRWSVSRDG